MVLPYICRCGAGFDRKEDKIEHMSTCPEARNTEAHMKANALKGMIRRRLIQAGKYTESAVEQVFNSVTDNGKDLSEVEVVSDPARVKELNEILIEVLGGNT